jgi:hypothetical protein
MSAMRLRLTKSLAKPGAVAISRFPRSAWTAAPKRGGGSERKAQLTMIQIARERKAMRTSLYDLSVPTFLQTVRSIGGFLDRAAAHFSNTGVDPDNFVHTRLFDDMAPFHFQIEAASHHSVWGVEALKTGAFTPPALVGPVPFTDLQAMIGKAETALEASSRLSPATVWRRRGSSHARGRHRLRVQSLSPPQCPPA